MMIRTLFISTLALALALAVLAASPALAAPFEDAKGKLIKCPETPAPAAKCKNAKGQFATCGTPG